VGKYVLSMRQMWDFTRDSGHTQKTTLEQAKEQYRSMWLNFTMEPEGTVRVVSNTKNWVAYSWITVTYLTIETTTWG